jgi:hypothetical protein
VSHQLLFGRLALQAVALRAVARPTRTPCLQQLKAAQQHKFVDIMMQNIFVMLMNSFCIQSVMKKWHC